MVTKTGPTKMSDLSNQLTVVMYHYVRDIEGSKYPGIKGITVRQFEGQIDYLARHYTFVSGDDLIAALDSENNELPRNAVLITFDDGYLDHFTNAFPILDRKGIPGCFYPPGKAITEQKVLDVNKIQFILAVEYDTSNLIKDISSMLDEFRLQFTLESNEEYNRRFAIPGRFDDKNIRFIKGILQKGLPADCRALITDRLFKKYVTQDEADFAGELYMTADQLRCIQDQGMHIGSHSYDHKWLDTLPPEEQELQVDLSLGFLAELGCPDDRWSFNYPYGGYNESMLSLLKERGVKFGLSTQVDLANLKEHDPLLLPRLDTNDLPKERDAQPNEWTAKVIG